MSKAMEQIKVHNIEERTMLDSAAASMATEQIRSDNQKESALTQARLECLRMAHSLEIENRRHKPAQEVGDVSAKSLVDTAELLFAFVKGE